MRAPPASQRAGSGLPPRRCTTPGRNVKITAFRSDIPIETSNKWQKSIGNASKTNPSNPAASGIGLEIRHLSGATGGIGQPVPLRARCAAVPKVTEAVTVAVSVAWRPSEMKHATTWEKVGKPSAASPFCDKSNREVEFRELEFHHFLAYPSCLEKKQLETNRLPTSICKEAMSQPAHWP